MSEPTHDLDFRERMIQKRFEKIKRTLLITSGKGGVGKSMVSATMAALMARAGMAVGLLDADVYGPSATFIFGVNTLPLEEEHGLTPPMSNGVKIMSVDLFAPGKPVPVGGRGARQIIKEILALTDWDKLDCLLVDMPPGTGDILMSLVKVIGSRSDGSIVVTVPSALSQSVVRRVLELLVSIKIPVFGMLENMAYLTDTSGITGPLGQGRGKALASEFGVNFLGELPIDYDAAVAIDDADIPALLQTKFAENLLSALKQANLIEK